MLDAFPVAILTGALLGYLAGIGVGGGSLLILWLTLVLDIEAPIARSVNLMFFIASAVAVSFFRWKRGTLQLKTILPAILAGCVSAAVFSLLSRHWDTEKLRTLFGLLLIVTGIRELLYKPKNVQK